MVTARLNKAALGAFPPIHRPQDPTVHQGVKRVMAGIACSNGRLQQQAKLLTDVALAVIRATSKSPRPNRLPGRKDSPEEAQRRARVDLALLSVLRDGLLRRSEAGALR